LKSKKQSDGQDQDSVALSDTARKSLSTRSDSADSLGGGNYDPARKNASAAGTLDVLA
jgi:hypothetical protein